MSTTLTQSQRKQLWWNATEFSNPNFFDLSASQKFYDEFCETLEIPDGVDFFVMVAPVDFRKHPNTGEKAALEAHPRRMLFHREHAGKGYAEDVMKEVTMDLKHLAPKHGYSYGLYTPPLLRQDGTIIRYAKHVWDAAKIQP